ncbi:hypothetical protein HZC07_01085 [Candidatus Micrarchaeota archaeon]|nr:hypothetical protein [Candidatus Micrarchaeota archaeon]
MELVIWPPSYAVSPHGEITSLLIEVVRACNSPQPDSLRSRLFRSITAVVNLGGTLVLDATNEDHRVVLDYLASSLGDGLPNREEIRAAAQEHLRAIDPLVV